MELRNINRLLCCETVAFCAENPVFETGRFHCGHFHISFFPLPHLWKI